MFKCQTKHVCEEHVVIHHDVILQNRTILLLDRDLILYLQKHVSDRIKEKKATADFYLF